MAFSTFRQKANEYYEFVCDAEDDVSKLPTDVAPGSIAFIIDSSSVYMMNNQETWVKL